MTNMYPDVIMKVRRSGSRTISVKDVHTFRQGFAAHIPESHFQSLQGDDLISYIGWCLVVSLHAASDAIAL